MNISFIFILMMSLAVGLFCMCRSGDDASHEQALAEIEKLHQRDMAASKEYDIETLVSLMADDIVLLQPGQEPLKGKEAVRANLEAYKEEMAQVEITQYLHTFEEVCVVGDWAYEWGMFHGASRPVSGGEETQERLRLFRILRRQSDGSWKVARAIWHAMPQE